MLDPFASTVGSSKTAAAGKGKQRGVPKILLLGSSDAGKTAIFSKVRSRMSQRVESKSD